MSKIREFERTRLHASVACTPAAMLVAMHRLRVLVVEDHHDIAANIGDYLTAHAHVVAFAEDGPRGLAAAATREFDAIVLDVMLPGFDGFAFCSRLREELGRDTPVILLTARDKLTDKLAGFEVGADDYVTKPFALEELEARLLAVVRRGNLIANAFHYTERGEVTIAIDARTLVVTDTGDGIDVARIGDPGRSFVHGDKSVGYGLGLAIVSSLCDRFGWTLQLARANNDAGTRATLTFA